MSPESRLLTAQTSLPLKSFRYFLHLNYVVENVDLPNYHQSYPSRHVLLDRVNKGHKKHIFPDIASFQF